MTITTRIAFDDGDALSEDVLSDGKLVGSIWFDPDAPMFGPNDPRWLARKMIPGEPSWEANALECKTREEALAVFHRGDEIIAAEFDPFDKRGAAIEDCVNVVTATWGADLLTTVRHLRALKDQDYDEWCASDPLGNPSAHP